MIMETAQLLHDEARFRAELAHMLNAARSRLKDNLESHSGDAIMTVGLDQLELSKYSDDSLYQVLDMEIVQVINEVHEWCASSLATSAQACFGRDTNTDCISDANLFKRLNQ